MRIEGAVALVTGANRGLGAALAQMLVERGAQTVYAAARDPAAITDPRLTPIRLDLTSEADIAAAAERCADVDLLVNNAATAYGTPLIGAPSMDAARAEMEANYFGTLGMCRAFAPVLAANGGGALVNMLSIVSFFAVPAMGSLCATKAALWSLTNAVRMELRPQGTQVTAVHASFIDTRLAAGTTLPKHTPADAAALIGDAIAEGREELLADARTAAMKAALPHDLTEIYPSVERQFLESRAAAQRDTGS